MTFTKNIPAKDELLELVDRKILMSHAVTMASDEYIKKSVDGFVFYYLLKENNIITVDENVDDLMKAMVNSSLDEGTIKMLMHGCVSRKQGYKIAVEDKDKKDRKKDVDEEAEAQSVESLKSSIEMAKDSMGTMRANKSKDGDKFCLSLPVRLNPDVLTFEGDSTLDTKEFIWDYLEQDAGLSMELIIPFSVLDKTLSTIKDMALEVAEDALGMARVSKLNDTTTNIVEDPWAMLGGMLNGM